MTVQTIEQQLWSAAVERYELLADRPSWAVVKTYKIVRFHQDINTPSEIIVRGLTLEQAQAHCQRDDTHGEGWFDGYDVETKSHGG